MAAAFFASAGDLLRRNSLTQSLTSTVQSYTDYTIAVSTELSTKIVTRAQEIRDDATTRALQLRDQAALRSSEVVNSLRKDVLSLQAGAATKVTQLREDAAARALNLRDRAVALQDTYVAPAVRQYVTPTAKKLLRTRGGRRLAAAVPDSVAVYVADHFSADAAAPAAEQEEDKKKEDGDSVPAPASAAAAETTSTTTSAPRRSIISSSSALIADLKSKLTVENARSTALSGVRTAADFSRSVATKVSSSAAYKKTVDAVPAAVFSKVAAAKDFAAPHVAAVVAGLQRLDAKFTSGSVSRFTADAAAAAGIGAAPAPQQQQPVEEDVAVAPAAPVNTPVPPPLKDNSAAAAEQKEECNEPSEAAAEDEQEL